jgi:outer membrane protein assembly factor BamB
MTTRYSHLSFFVVTQFCLAVLLSLGAFAKDTVGETDRIETTKSVQWPMYRADAQRSGYSPESLAESLEQSWKYDTPHKPQPAWPRSDRQTFDWSVQPIIVDNHCYFGDSVTGCLVAVNLKSGKTDWHFVTGGPIRFAPVAFENFLFIVSDDGYLYALDRHSGMVAWKHRGGPDHAKRLGNDRMISRWPARGGPVVSDDKLYYAAGIWPTDGIFLYALDPRTGRELWANDDSGQMYMPQPHGGADAESGVAAQGHLVASKSSDGAEWLLVPTGRAVPAAFDRTSGSFKYFQLQKFGQKGASAVAANDRFFANSGMLFNLNSGDAVHTIGNSPVAMLPEGMVAYVDKLLTVYAWQEVEKADRKGAISKSIAPVPLWSVEGVPAPVEIIVAGSKIVVGTIDEVLMIDRDSREIVWRTSIEGRALSLAAANQRLLVATDRGSIYCFDASQPDDSPAVSQGTSSDITAKSNTFAEQAKQIVELAGFDEGYCLDFGCGDGQLSEALAKVSTLHIIAIDSDAAKLKIARERLLASGLLGSRVSVIAVDDLSDTGLPNYFANLVVSQLAFEQGSDDLPKNELSRLVRPYGGITAIGKVGSLTRTARGPLEGAGEWTHQYGTAGNSTSSQDQHIKGTLGMLWFRDVDVAMPQRHGRGPGPLFYDGRLYSMGLHELACVDAYNGRLVWRYPLPNILSAYDGDQLMGTAGTHSPYCISEDGVYVRYQGHCLRLDRVNGQQLEKFEAPVDVDGKPGIWGYIACSAGVLVGSLADPEHVVTFRYLERGGDMSSLLTESKSLFGMDSTSGEVLWRYDARHSIRHNALAMDSSSLYLIDRPQALEDRVKTAKVENHPAGVLVALDAKTGIEKWRSEDSIDGTLLALSDQHSVLLMASQPTRFALDSEKAEFLTAIDPHTGKQLWRRPAKYSSRPMINDRTIYSEGGAWDLFSGSPIGFEFKRSYGCGVLTGSKHTMLFRSATLGYFDFQRQGKVENYGGIRPGCWINAIPAGGLVLMPDASAGCVCSYLNQAWFALEADGTYPPKISPHGGQFESSTLVTLTPDQPQDLVRYTLDGSTPTASSTRYSQPILIETSVRLKARAFTPEGRPGRTVQQSFSIAK